MRMKNEESGIENFKFINWLSLRPPNAVSKLYNSKSQRSENNSKLLTLNSILDLFCLPAATERRSAAEGHASEE